MTPDQLIDSAERMLLQANNRVDRVMWARRYLELIEARPADRESADRAASTFKGENTTSTIFSPLEMVSSLWVLSRFEDYR